MSTFLKAEEGYYSLTPAGVMVVFVAITMLIIATALISKSAVDRTGETDNASRRKRQVAFSARQLVFSAVALALAFALSYVKLIPMPWGGAVTPCSMLFVVLIGYWYGQKIGFTAAFAYALLQFVQDGSTYILSPLQACLDYILAFTALGVAGFFRGKIKALRAGYLVAIILRGLFHTVGGYLFWMDYMPENFPKSLAAIYPLCYNYAYIGLEGVITIALLMIPAVVKVIGRISMMAGEEGAHEVSVI